MKLCFNTSAYSQHGLEYALGQIAGYGYWGAEIEVSAKHLLPQDWSGEQIATLKQKLENWNLHPVSLMSANVPDWGYSAMFEPSFINQDPGIRRLRIEKTKEVIDVAAALGCQNIQTGAGTCNFAGFPMPDVAWTRLVDGLAECSAYAAEKGIFMTVESEPGTMVENTVDFALIVKDVNSPAFGLTFDVGHLAILGEDVLQAIRLLHESIINVHLDDMAGRRHLHMIPGQGDGTLNLKRILQELKAVGYDRTVTCDLYSQCADPNRAAALSIEYLKPIFETLNG